MDLVKFSVSIFKYLSPTKDSKSEPIKSSFVMHYSSDQMEKKA